MTAVRTEDGQTLHVDDSDGDRGSKGPFFVAYTDGDKRERWGWYCSHCRSLATAMDPMGRIECTDCGNVRKPTEWDAAHE